MCSIVFFLFVVFCEYAAWNGLVGKLRLAQSGRHAHWSKYEGRCAFARVVTDVVVVVAVVVVAVVVEAFLSPREKEEQSSSRRVYSEMS